MSCPVVLRGRSLAQFLIHFQRAVSHVERLEDLVVQEIAIAFARHSSNYLAENSIAQIRVIKVISGRLEQNAITLDGGVGRNSAINIVERASSCIGCQATSTAHAESGRGSSRRNRAICLNLCRGIPANFTMLPRINRSLRAGRKDTSGSARR